MLFWEASFGPFEIFKTGSLRPGMAGDMGSWRPTPPPSMLPRPRLAADGYGHLLGTWIHNSSADPGQNVGRDVLRLLGRRHLERRRARHRRPVRFLISDPEVAFAGPGKAAGALRQQRGTSTPPSRSPGAR